MDSPARLPVTLAVVRSDVLRYQKRKAIPHPELRNLLFAKLIPQVSHPIIATDPVWMGANGVLFKHYYHKVLRLCDFMIFSLIL